MEQDWKTWSLDAKGLRWRIALPSDQPALTALLDDAESILGKQERANLFEFPVVLTLVAEDEEGRIIDGLYIEFEAFVRKLGLNRQGMQSAEALVPMLGGFLESRKIRLGRVAVPRRLARVMRESMARMKMYCDDSDFIHFVRRIRQ